MAIHAISDTPSPELQAALAAFESKFLYPLSNGEFFLVTHLPDRTGLLRTLAAEWSLFAADRDSRILGTADLALTTLHTPSAAPVPAIFYREIRLLEEARRKTVAYRVIQATEAWFRARANSLVAIASDDTPLKPPDYTGRLGISKRRAVGSISHIRIPLSPASSFAPDPAYHASEPDGLAAFARLAAPFAHLAPTSAAPRSILAPQWLIHPDGTACARIEDRRRVIRLITTTGSELRPAFLSCFAFSDPVAARQLIHAACAIAAQAGATALRFYIPAQSLDPLRAAAPAPLPASPATVYGSMEVPTDATWLFNASET